jgi:hypothetical protein
MGRPVRASRHTSAASLVPTNSRWPRIATPRFTTSVSPGLRTFCWRVYRQICRPVRASIAVTVRVLPPLVPYITPSTTSGVLSLMVSPGTGADHAARSRATFAVSMLVSGE